MLVVLPMNGITIYDEVPPVERATGISLFIAHSDEIVKAFHLLLLINIRGDKLCDVFGNIHIQLLMQQLDQLVGSISILLVSPLILHILKY